MSGEYCKSGCTVGQCKMIGFIAVEKLAAELFAERPTDVVPSEVYKRQLNTLLDSHASLLGLCAQYEGTDILHSAIDSHLPPAA